MVYYSCAEYKSLSQAEAQPLKELEEVRGQLLRIYEAEGRCIAVFCFGEVAFPVDLRERLVGLVGRKCAILKLDGKYHFREV